MERAKLSELKANLERMAVRMERRTCNPKGASYEVFEFRVEDGGRGRPLFTVGVDDLFDYYGNRFEDDLS